MVVKNVSLRFRGIVNEYELQIDGDQLRLTRGGQTLVSETVEGLGRFTDEARCLHMVVFRSSIQPLTIALYDKRSTRAGLLIRLQTDQLPEWGIVPTTP